MTRYKFLLYRRRDFVVSNTDDEISSHECDSGSELPVFPLLHFPTRKISGAKHFEIINREIANYSFLVT